MILTNRDGLDRTMIGARPTLCAARAVKRELWPSNWLRLPRIREYPGPAALGTGELAVLIQLPLPRGDTAYLMLYFAERPTAFESRDDPELKLQQGRPCPYLDLAGTRRLQVIEQRSYTTVPWPGEAQ